MLKDIKTLHTFVISAWQESPFIEDALKSLLNQNYKSEIIVATSSPNDFLKGLCEKYSVKYVINPDAYMAGAQINWSFAYAQARTKYVTLAHQDDIYLPDYSEKMVAAAEHHPDVLIAFSRCANLRNGKRKYFDLLLLIKDVFLIPYYLKHAIYSAKIRLAVLMLGNPICCPTVMFNKELIGPFYFDQNIVLNFDWDAWLRLCRKRGAFLFCSKTIALHRIHSESGTTVAYNDGSRQKDDFEFFCRFWPKPVAKILTKIYGLARFLN